MIVLTACGVVFEWLERWFKWKEGHTKRKPARLDSMDGRSDTMLVNQPVSRESYLIAEELDCRLGSENLIY
jgi:hypothetical protein